MNENIKDALPLTCAACQYSESGSGNCTLLDGPFDEESNYEGRRIDCPLKNGYIGAQGKK